MMRTEPNITIGGTVSAILGGVFLILKGAGVLVPGDIEDGVNIVIMGLCAVPFVTTWLARFFVYAPETVQDVANTAARTGNAPKIT